MAPTPTPVVAPVSFTRYGNNPVLASGAPGSWEAQLSYSTVVFNDGLFHLFYTGVNPDDDGKMAIGYASSPDGFTFTRYASNPILSGDGSGFDAHSVSRPVVLLDGDTWVLYYTAHPVRDHPLGGPAIGRATASSPTGPWTMDVKPVLQVGGWAAWDGEPQWFGVVPSSVLLTDDGYVMYYTSHHRGDVSPPRIGGACGMATSPDGVHWTKYNDPATASPPQAQSDPVLQPGPRWDTLHAFDCRVFRTERGWELLYASFADSSRGHQISYASSSDGIHWTKFLDGKAVMGLASEPLTRNGREPHLSPTAIVQTEAGYLFYYMINFPMKSIGVATLTLNP